MGPLGRLLGSLWAFLGRMAFQIIVQINDKQSVFVKTIAFAMLALLVQFIRRASRIQFDYLYRRVGLGYQHELCLFRQRYLPLAPTEHSFLIRFFF